MTNLKATAYKDTVEIVKAAVSAMPYPPLGRDADNKVTARYMQSVYDKLCEILEDAQK